MTEDQQRKGVEIRPSYTAVAQKSSQEQPGAGQRAKKGTECLPDQRPEPGHVKAAADLAQARTFKKLQFHIQTTPS